VEKGEGRRRKEKKKKKKERGGRGKLSTHGTETVGFFLFFLRKWFLERMRTD
jgi:hypothetical protein